MPWSSFSECWALSQLFHSSFTFIKLAVIQIKDDNIMDLGVKDLRMTYFEIELKVEPKILLRNVSLSPKVCPSSCPLHWWYHPAISSSDAVFSFCPQSLLASGTFPMSHNRWPKFWSFNFSISPSNEYSVLISLKIDWFDLLAVQGALRSLLQHHNSKPSTLWRTAFLMVQLSQPYVTTGKTIYLQMVFNHRDFQYSTGLHSE